jgi:chemotaxis methyl-accepting protein methylase
MRYVQSLPTSVSFRGKGLVGYSFGPLNEKDLEVLYIESEKGHDTFLVSKRVTRVYYVIAGTGHFTIDNRQYGVTAGMLVEIPPRLEYSYSGHMTLLALCTPRWSPGNEKFTKWNPDVVGFDSLCPADSGSWLTRLINVRIFGKSPINACLRLNTRLWNILPSSVAALRPLNAYGHFLHGLARVQGGRAQAFSTFFLRNRPQLDLIQRLLDRKSGSDTLRVAVLGCSVGAEVYSIAWKAKSTRPDVRVVLNAVDISKEAVEFAKRGQYSLKAKLTGMAIHDYMAAGRWLLGQPDSELTGAEIFDRMTPVEMEEFFDRQDDVVTVKDSIKEGIDWHVADARDPGDLEGLGLQDVVVANNFLCHMDDVEAERCLRNIARLVAPQGYLVVSGIDLGVRTKVAHELGWKPVQDLLEEIHDGDSCLRSQWPCQYEGLEPLNKKRRDWRMRYAAVFQLEPIETAAPVLHGQVNLREDSYLTNSNSTRRGTSPASNPRSRSF